MPGLKHQLDQRTCADRLPVVNPRLPRRSAGLDAAYDEPNAGSEIGNEFHRLAEPEFCGIGVHAAREERQEDEEECEREEEAVGEGVSCVKAAAGIGFDFGFQASYFTFQKKPQEPRPFPFFPFLRPPFGTPSRDPETQQKIP